MSADPAWDIELALQEAWHDLPDSYGAPSLPTSLILRDLSYAVINHLTTHYPTTAQQILKDAAR